VGSRRQYFHYLTKWMRALDQVARFTGRPLFNTWARELARTTHRAFIVAAHPGGAPRMYWKVSIDLSRPLVAAMGQHDPLDGLVTCVQLAASAGGEGGLCEAIADFAAMLDPRRLVSADPLAIGGLLVDAYRVAQLERRGAARLGLLGPLLESAQAGLTQYLLDADLDRPAARRLAFRELGLAIGLAALERDDWPQPPPAGLLRYASLGADIQAFWRQATHRRGESWTAHADINDVMLAASLQPNGVLQLL
jgi:hypothetical protein